MDRCAYPRCDRPAVALVLATKIRVCGIHANAEQRWGATVIRDEEN